ncbi:MAG TPA: universal stress protein [Nannocystis sp.]|jgi:nucleotide-binding universal stress UspA family protein
MTIADPDTWILGLDLGARGRGAVRVADWLAGPDRTIGVHVLEHWTRPYIRPNAISAVHEAVRRIGDEFHVTPPARISVLEAASAEEGLAEAARGAAGLVIGRVAGSRQDTPFGLGRVARRLLRSLPGPVVVVPRDLEAVAPGPVLLATDLDESSDAAAAFARALAGKHGRELVVVHVGERRHSDLIDELEPSWLAAREAYRDELAAALARWMARHDLAQAPRRVVYGSTVDELVTLAATIDAAMLVVGSRRLGAAGRVFLGSTASALAGRAACPVAVIPPA